MKDNRKCVLGIIMIVVPLLIVVQTLLWENHNYYVIASLYLVIIMYPIFKQYKVEKNGKRLVLLASLSAIASIGRLAFFMVPQFKPVLALVIISSITLGGYDGFIVGALTAFISNFYFGQGPWTIWQMFSFGLAGFLAGIVFQKIPRTTFLVCLYGFLSAFLVYGFIMNFYSVLFFSRNFSKMTIFAVYGSGMMFDFVHALSTAIFLLIGYKPFCEKLERIQIKFGI